MEGIILYFVTPFVTALTSAINSPSPILGALGFSWFLITHGGWVLVLLALFKIAEWAWLDYVQGQYAANRQWVCLAIDVPKDNVQSPKAVENIFAHMAGAHSNPDLKDIYWDGVTQDYFSFEIVGIEGYVQFIIRTVKKYRDLVESSVYAQYPDAQITEIEDYTTGFPSTFPDEKYNMYGTEFVLVANELLPLRTYQEFEHQMSQEYKDPLTTLLEGLNKLGPGEQVWLQFIIVPTSEDWKKPASAYIKKVMGQAPKSSGGGILSNAFGELGNLSSEMQKQVTGIGAGEAPKKPEKPAMMMLPPDDAARADGAARKIKKIGFKTKIRFIYIAQKEKFHAPHGVHNMVGFIKQYNTGDLNSLKPDTKHVGVHAHYIYVEPRKNMKRTKLMMRYKARSWYGGRDVFVLNTEELATLWHFPLKTDTAPIRHMVQKTEFKHTPPPSRLPIVEDLKRATVFSPPPTVEEPENEQESFEQPKGQVPPNLPIS